jgi:hypothetical protein
MLCGKSKINRGNRRKNTEERTKFNASSPENMSRIVVPAPRHRMSSLVAYVDGGSLGNPGPSGIGVVIDGSENGRIEIKKWIGHQDNNVAEYVALLEVLQCALELSAGTLHVFSDSEVVVKQIRGNTVAATRGSIPCIGPAGN